MRKLTLSASLLLLAGCSNRTQSRVVTPRQPAAVHTSMGRQIRNAVDAGEGDLVASRLRDRMVSQPGNVAVRLELAAHYHRLGHKELALEHYRLVADRDPANCRAALAIAQILREQDRTDEAARSLETFLAKNVSESSELPAWLGLLYDEAGEPAKAEGAHRAALALDASNAKLHNNLGYNLLSQGRRDDAIAEFRRALSLDAKLEIARGNLALALSRGSQQERGEALLYWQAMQGPASAHNNLAAVLIEQGEYPEARQELETALRYSKGFLPAMRNLAIVAERDGHPAVLPAAGRQAAPQARRPRQKFWDAVIGKTPKTEAAQHPLTSSKSHKGERTSQ